MLFFTADFTGAVVVEKGMPFRDAYKRAAEMKQEDVNLQKNIASRKSLGAPGNLDITGYRQRIQSAKTS